MSIQPQSLQFSLAALSGLLSFWLGLSLLLLSRLRRVTLLAGLLATGGLLVCYALAGSYPGKGAAAFYFGCLSALLFTAQLACWLLIDDGPVKD